MLNEMPSDMILLFKTNDCLRHLDSLLGVPINTMQVVASTTADVIRSEELAVATTWWDTLAALSRYAQVMSRAGALALSSNAFNVYSQARVYYTYWFPDVV